MDGHDSPVVLINLFAVPATADDGFVAGWERARDFLAGQDGYLSTELHRSLAPDADFRFVNVAQWRSAGAFEAAMSQPDFPGRELPFAAHPGLYRVVREDPPPAGDADGVVLINAFEVPADGDERFLAGWGPTREFLRGEPGYLATRLHRSMDPRADFRFVNVARWAGAREFQAAIGQRGFREVSAAIPYRAHPGLYEVVRR
jgi:heme oxygenase (mycobilin-producing)